MADRGRTKNCAQLFTGLTDSYREVAKKCALDEASIRKFRNGDKIIRRTTFNKVCECLRDKYKVDFNPEDHWIEANS